MLHENDRPQFSFAIIADSHITEEEGLAIDGTIETGKKVAGMYRDIIERVSAMEPEFVVHLGDITHPAPSEPDYGDAALAFHKASDILSMPYYLVPGNHDIGEKLHPALPELDADVSITKRNIGMYEQHFGRQRYSFKHQDCMFIVINSMLINSGLEEEQDQWDWLEETLENHSGGRSFVFSHYPLYLSTADEADHYDNIDQPGRSRLMGILAQHNVEGFYAGHVHNFFYNHLEGMHQFVLPSTSIIRHDYLEYFKMPPSREIGRFDPAKTGFFWVDVYSDGHIPHLVRTKGDSHHITHSWAKKGAFAMMDLRVPWCDEADIATPWAVEIFERKLIRNDYPLSALWEMGIKEFRIPITDIMNPKTASRVAELIGLGHRFNVVMFGAPDAGRQTALAALGDGVKSVEVVGLLSQWPSLIEPLTLLKKNAGYKIYLNAVRPEVQGWTTHHGLHTDLVDELDVVLEEPDLKQAVDGFVFGIRHAIRPFDGFRAVQECLQGADYEFILHVPCVGFDKTSAPTDEASGIYELARTAEATMLARVNPDKSIVLDNFVELDRGYFNCRGLVDRLYNPKDGSRIMSSLDRFLPSDLSCPAIFETDHHRIISAKGGTSSVLLIVANDGGALSADATPFSGGSIDKQGILIDLMTGRSSDVSYQALKARLDEGSKFSPAMLYVFDEQGI